MDSESRSPLRHRDFALFWVALVTTGFAMAMATVAIGWQVYAVRENPLDLGLVGLAEFLPLLLLALPAGHVADRFPRRRVYALMIVMDVVVFASLLGVTLQGAERVWPFYALAFVTGSGSAFGAAAGRALTPSLVPEEILVSALAQRSIAFQLSLVVGPAVGGLLFAIRAELVYVVAIGLSLVALGCVLALHGGRQPAVEGVADLDEVLAGVRLIRRTNVLLGAISLDLFAVLLGGATGLLPVFARDVLEVGPQGFGILRASPAVGALVVAMYLAYRPIRTRAGVKMLLSVGLFGLMTVVFAFSRWVPLSVFALAVLGGADMVSVFTRQSLVQIATPDRMRGRVSAVATLFIGASNELGEFESGVVARVLGPVGAVAFGGAGAAAVTAVWAWLFPRLRSADRLV
jgi:MFS family permease